jgi:hypothetical protein
MGPATAVLLAILSAAPTQGDVAAPRARGPLTIREPSWKGAVPSVVNDEYRQALAKLQALAGGKPAGAPLRITSPAPCVLRLERGDELASVVDATRRFLHQVTWIDLRRGARLGARAFGRNAGAAPALVATCAWLTGSPDLALSTEFFFLEGSREPVRRTVLGAEEQPRICVANEVEPEDVAAPLRRLVTICGGEAVAIPQVVERTSSPEEMLISTWEGGLAERVEELVRDGEEAAVLGPLSRYPVAARIMLGYFRRSERLLERKLAPALAGLLGKEAPPGTLDELFESEAARRADALRGGGAAAGGDARMATANRVLEQAAGRPGLAGYFDAQSVVEDVVIAARGWCGDPSRAPAGAAILRKVVERTIAGEDWNSAGPAMKGLVCDCHEGSADLLPRFATYAFAVPPLGSPLPTHLQARKEIEELRAGRCEGPRHRGGTSNVDPLASWSRRDQAGLRAFLLMAESAK